jgi:hypothetical protein
MPADATQHTRTRLAPALVAICAGVGAAFALVAAASTPDAPLTQNAPLSADALSHAGESFGAFAIRAVPSTATVAPGETTTYEVRIRRGSPTSHTADGSKRYVRVRLRVAAKSLPIAATATFVSRATRGRRSLLSVATAPDTPPGIYRLVLKARRKSGTAGRRDPRRARTATELVVGERQSRSFAISGTLPRLLAPGIAVPLDLVLTNPHSDDLTISEITTELRAVDAPQGDAIHPCTADDFALTQFSGPYGFEVASDSTASLSDLGIPESSWPQVGMVDRAVNQDGCKNASLRLGFTGTGTGGGS